MIRSISAASTRSINPERAPDPIRQWLRILGSIDQHRPFLGCPDDDPGRESVDQPVDRNRRLLPGLMDLQVPSLHRDLSGLHRVVHRRKPRRRIRPWSASTISACTSSLSEPTRMQTHSCDSWWIGRPGSSGSDWSPSIAVELSSTVLITVNPPASASRSGFAWTEVHRGELLTSIHLSLTSPNPGCPRK